MRFSFGGPATLPRPSRLVFAALIVFTALWFALLAQRPLFDPDEGRYAEIPHEMLVRGDWVIPHLDSLVYLEKPPLQYWLTAAAYRALGESEFAARLWTGIAGYCSLGLVFFVARRLWGTAAGVRALLLMLGSSLFVLLGHQLTLDMMLSTWLTAALACFLMAEAEASTLYPCSRRHRAWMLGCWVSMAFAVLTKGLIGVFIPACTLGLYAVWQRDAGIFRRLHVLRGLPLLLLIVTPWFAFAAHENGSFLQYFFIREHLQRFLTPIENRTEPWWFFLPVLAIGILPWLPQALRAAAQPFGRNAHPFHPERLLWIWASFIVVFFSCSNSKLIPYVLPAVAALALLCASPAAGEPRRELGLGAVLSIAASLALLVYTQGICGTDRSRDLALLLRPSLRVTAALLAAAGAGCLWLLRRRATHEAVLGVLCLGWLLATGSVLAAANRVQDRFSSKDAALTLRARDRTSAPVFSVRNYEQSFTFYLKRPVVLVDYRDEFTLGLSQAPHAGISTVQEFAARWRTLDQAYALMPYYEYSRLARQGLPMHELARYPNNTILVSRHP